MLLPQRDDARVLATDVDPATLSALSRSFDVVDEQGDGVYDVIVRGGEAAPTIDQLAPGGVWVDLAGDPPAGLDSVRRYAMLPSSTPRMIVPLAPRRTRSAGLRFHEPTRFQARCLAGIAAVLSDMGFSRHLGRTRVIMGQRPGASRGTTLAQWLEARLGRAIDDLLIYTGSNAPHRKMTLLATGRGDLADFVVKIADTGAAADSIERELQAMRLLTQSGADDLAPRRVCDGTWGRYRVAVHGCMRSPAWRREMTGLHSAFLRRLARINAATLPAKMTRLWEETFHHQRDDAAGDLARIDQLNPDEPVTCHMIHGDFAPWNLCRHGSTLLAVDWEDADPCGASCVDIYHLLFRTAANVGPWPGGRVMAGRMKLAALQHGASQREVDVTLRLWLAREAWTQPASRDMAVEVLANL